MDLDFERIWKDSPIGVSVYLPVFENQQLKDMTLVWVNRAVSRLANFEPADILGWPVSRVIGAQTWDSVRHRYAELIDTGEWIGYARSYNQNGIGFDYRSAAWYAPPYVAVQVRETSADELPYKEADDIRAALRLVQHRQEATMELARLLTRLQNTEADSAEIEPATSRTSDSGSVRNRT